MWAGLGYYRRARFLLQGARHVCDALGGVFPTTSSELQTIPGVGAYTGNAIASIACGQPVAVMDANVIRVVSRLFTITGDPGQREVLDKMNAVAGKLLDPGRPGDYNQVLGCVYWHAHSLDSRYWMVHDTCTTPQAMMELGAVVCLGNGAEPKCTTCPLQHHCGAYKAVQDYVHKGGHKDDAAAPLVTRYPEKVQDGWVFVCETHGTTYLSTTLTQPAKKDKREEHVAVCVVQHREDAATAIELHSYLLAKRPEQGLLAGLWEFPSVAVDADANENARKAALDKLLQGTLGLEHALSQWRVVHRRAIGSTVHVFSHIRMTLHVEHLLVDGPVGDEKKHQDASTASHTMWVTHASLSNGTHKLSGAPSKVFNMINDKQNGGGKSAPENNTTITSFFKPS